MSIWAKIAKYGGSALKGAGSVAKQGLKSASNTAVHPTQALKGAGSAMKTAAVGSAAGYVAWQNLVNDKSMVEIASDVVVGKDTTEKISEAVEDVKGLKNKAGEAVDAVNGAMGDINSKWSGMSNFFRGSRFIIRSSAASFQNGSKKSSNRFSWKTVGISINHSSNPGVRVGAKNLKRPFRRAFRGA